MVENKVKEHRERLEMSQQEVSRRAKIAASDLSAIENGRREAWPRARRRLSKILGVPVLELFPENGGNHGGK